VNLSFTLLGGKEITSRTALSPDTALKRVENFAAQAQVEIRLTSLTVIKRYRCVKAADPEAGMLLLSLATGYINR